MLTRLVLALVLASSLLLTGCKSAERPDAGPSDSPATSPSTDSTPSGSPSSESTGVEPASGTLVESDEFSYRLPAGVEWNLGRGGLGATTYDDDLNAFDVDATLVPLQAGDDVADLAKDYEVTAGDLPYDPPLKRGENRVVDGVEGWTAQTVENGQLIYAFGTRHNRVSFDLFFGFPKKDPRTLEWIEAVLASIEWK